MSQKIDFWGWVLIGSLLITLSYCGYLSYKSIDYKVLKKLEEVPLSLPPVATQSALPLSTPSATPATNSSEKTR